MRKHTHHSVCLTAFYPRNSWNTEWIKEMKQALLGELRMVIWYHSLGIRACKPAEALPADHPGWLAGRSFPRKKRTCGMLKAGSDSSAKRATERFLESKPCSISSGYFFFSALLFVPICVADAAEKNISAYHAAALHQR
mgnify:CR=1 FL=1